MTKNWVSLSNLQNLWLESWDRDNRLENKSINNCEAQLQVNPMLKDEIEKKKSVKKKDKKIIWVNITNL
jgi:hypothetical protein